MNTPHLCPAQMMHNHHDGYKTNLTMIQLNNEWQHLKLNDICLGVARIFVSGLDYQLVGNEIFLYLFSRIATQEAKEWYNLLLRLLEGHSKLLLQDKLLTYKIIIQSIWAYELEHKVNKSQQSKTLRKIVNVPFYVSTLNIYICMITT